MKALNQQKTELFRNILLITLGSLLYALNFDLFLEPGGISSGGVSGIAMIIVYAAHPKFLTVGILNAMINIPLFLCGLKKIGRHFFFGSLYSTVLTSIFLDLFARILPVPTVEPLVAALFGGVFMGARNRVTPTGIELERLPLPRALMDRLRATEERLRAID